MTLGNGLHKFCKTNFASYLQTKQPVKRNLHIFIIKHQVIQNFAKLKCQGLFKNVYLIVFWIFFSQPTLLRSEKKVNF